MHSLNGIPGTLLLQFLEMRLDTIIYNLGFAVSISNARQFITHGHIDINKKNINIPSFQCKPNDIISINYNSNLISFVKKNLKIRNYLELPKYLKLDKKKNIGIVKSIIERQEINVNIQELLVVEFYSKK